jgi:hypothetical protein
MVGEEMATPFMEVHRAAGRAIKPRSFGGRLYLKAQRRDSLQSGPGSCNKMPR